MCIGKNNKLLFRLKVDLRRFKKLTMGKPIIMGRKTYESIGKPLPGRCNIIVSRTLTDNLPDNLSECKVCQDLTEALDYAKQYIREHASKLDGDEVDKEIMIIGGGDIYRQTLPMATKLFITEVGVEEGGDTYFPKYAASQWREERSENYDDGGIPCVFRILSRVV